MLPNQDIPVRRIMSRPMPNERSAVLSQVNSAQPHIALYRRIATVFVVLTLAVVGLAVYVVMTHATIVVLSKPEEVKTEFLVEVTNEPEAGEIRGLLVTAEKEMTKTANTPVGAKTEAKAEGRVQISSRLNRPQPLIATTRLMTADGKLYRLSEDVSVPANGTVEAKATADVVGPAMETADATFVIPGLNDTTRALFSVKTISPFVGGVREGRTVSQSDVDAALAALKEEATQSLLGDLRDQAKNTGVTESGEIATIDIIETSVEPSVGSATEAFVVKAKARASVIFYDKAQLRIAMNSKIGEVLAFDRKLDRLLVDQATVVLEKSNQKEGHATLKVSVKGVTTLSPQTPALEPEQFAGVSIETAKEYLGKIGGVMSVSISIAPAWSTRLPSEAKDIKVEVR